MLFFRRGSLDYVNNSGWMQSLLPHHRAGLQYTNTGYGSKIPSQYKTKVGNRWYRVYFMIYSNSGTPYIISKGKTYILENQYISNPVCSNYNNGCSCKMCSKNKEKGSYSKLSS